MHLTFLPCKLGNFLGLLDHHFRELIGYMLQAPLDLKMLIDRVVT